MENNERGKKIYEFMNSLFFIHKGVKIPSEIFKGGNNKSYKSMFAICSHNSMEMLDLFGARLCP